MSQGSSSLGPPVRPVCTTCRLVASASEGKLTSNATAAEVGRQLRLLILCLALLLALAWLPGLDGVSALEDPVAWHVEMSIVGQLGGAVRTVALQGNTAYIGVGPRLAVLDVLDRERPRFLGQTVWFADVVQAVAASPSSPHVYVAAGTDGLHVVDVSVPTSPTVIASWSVPARFVGLVQEDMYLYIGTEGLGLRILDVSEPGHPREVAHYLPDSPGAVTVRGMDVQDGYAYVTADSAGLHMLDVDDPEDPGLVAVWPTTGYAHDVEVSGTYGYLAAEPRWSQELGAYVGGGLRVISLRDRLNPSEVGFVSDIAGGASRVVVRDSVAYVAAPQAGLLVIDVSAPEDPREVGVFADAAGVVDLGLAGAHAYLAGSGGGLRVISIAQPGNPRQVGTFATLHDVQAIAVRRGYAYIADGLNGLRVVDTGDPAILALSASLNLPGYASDLAIEADHAYVASQDTAVADAGLHRVRIARPSAPTDAGLNQVPAYAHSVSAREDWVYVSDEGQGVQVFSLPHAGAPSLVASVSTPGQARGIALSGVNAYVADGRAGLQVMHVGDPANPQLIGACRTVRDAWSIAVTGTLGYVADARWGVAVLDLSSSHNPTEVARYDTPGNARHIVLQASHAFVADLYGVRVLRSAAGLAIDEAGFLALPGLVAKVALEGSQIYVAAGEAGLYVLHFAFTSPTPTPTLTAGPTATATATATATPRVRRIYLPLILRSHTSGD